jgi:hypothetical protein
MVLSFFQTGDHVFGPGNRDIAERDGVNKLVMQDLDLLRLGSKKADDLRL